MPRQTDSPNKNVSFLCLLAALNAVRANLKRIERWDGIGISVKTTI